MNLESTPFETIPDLLLLKPKVFGDDRGFFFESFNQKAFDTVTGTKETFVQDNRSKSVRGVLRGIHYQIQQAQGKLVQVLQGEVYDVMVDLRKSSPTFGKWVGYHLNAEKKELLWIPKGFGHGFVVLSESAEFFYKTTDYYSPEYERSIRYDDPTLNIEWPYPSEPILSAKDQKGVYFKQAEVFAWKK